MGFVELLGKAMSQLFAPQTQATTQQWAENLTIEEIEEYERQGLDMSEYRRMREQKADAEQKLIQDSMDAIDLSKLDLYKQPRNAEDAFVTDVIKFNGLSDKKKTVLENAPLIYGKVVQAYSKLYEPGNIDNAGIVLLYALDEAHTYDIEWLSKTAERISEMKESDFVPKDCEEFIKTLRDDSSVFCVKLGESLSEGADAWCIVYQLKKQSQLPLSYIPHNGIIPLLFTEAPTKDNFWYAAIQLIPPAYYMK